MSRFPARLDVNLFLALLIPLALLVLPSLTRLYSLFLHYMIFLVTAISFNLVAGYVGYFSLGHIVFVGLGGYFTALTMWKLNMNIFLAIPLSSLLVAAVAVGVGVPTLKLRGPYFAISTLGLAVAARHVIVVMPDTWAGGSVGIFMPRIINLEGSYYSMTVLVLVSMFLTYFLLKSKVGVWMRAVRDDEDAAETMGVNSRRVKVLVFSLSAVLAGLAGSLNFWQFGYIEPISAFYILTIIEVIAMTLVGGLGTFLGPIVGVTVLYAFRHYTWVAFPGIQLAIFGTLIVLAIILSPGGIMGTVRRRFPRYRTMII